MLTWREVIEVEDVNNIREFGHMCSNINILRQGRALIMMLPNDGFRALSSGFTNGGFMDSPQAIVNISGMGGKIEYSTMAGGLDEHDESTLAYVSRLGLDPQRTVCMATAANMDNAVITNETSSDGTKISAAVTGGILHNGGRSGDPATYDESNETYTEKAGTIIIMISIDADLSDGAMFGMMMAATEIKSCVIQELQAKSLYDKDIATGSGTDQVVIVSNKNSETKIGYFGRDSDLFSCLSEVIRRSLFEALDRQSGMNMSYQCDPLIQMGRYGLVQDHIRDEIRFPARMDELLSALASIRDDEYLATMTSAILHIEDDVRHGLIPEEIGLELARTICLGSVLEPREDPVEQLRLNSVENIEELVSYVSALKLMDVVKERRCSDE